MQDFISAPKQIDKLFCIFPEYGHFRLFEITKQSHLSPSDKNLAEENDAIEIMLISTFKYVESTHKSNLFFKLTDLGREVKETGGHFAYLKKIADKAAADTERQKLSDEKLKYDVKNAKRIFKTYWWTFWLAIIGFVISLVLGVLKLLEVFKPLH
jgi:hypothetical protein